MRGAGILPASRIHRPAGPIHPARWGRTLLLALCAVAGLGPLGCGREPAPTRVEYSVIESLDPWSALGGYPWGAAVRPGGAGPGEVWVAVAGIDRHLTRLSAAGAFLGTIHLPTDSTQHVGQLCSTDSTLWVTQLTSLTSGSLFIASTSGQVLKTIQLGEGYRAEGIACSQGRIYVSELAALATSGPQRCHVKVFGSDGTLLGVFGNTGPDALSLNRGLAARDSSIYVCNGSEVRVYRPDGRLVARWGPGAAVPPGGWWEPTDVGLTPEGHLLVVDGAARAVEEFTPDGTYISRCDASASGNTLFAPQSVACQADGHGGAYVYVTGVTDGMGMFYILRREVVPAKGAPGLLRPEAGR